MRDEISNVYKLSDDLLSTYKESKLYVHERISEKIWSVMSPSDVALRRATAAIKYNVTIKALKNAFATIFISSSIS